MAAGGPGSETAAELQVYFGDLGTSAPDEGAAAAGARYRQAHEEADMDFLAVVTDAPSTWLTETAARATGSGRRGFVALDAWSFGPREIGQPVVVLSDRGVEDVSDLPLGRFDLFYRFWLPDHARTSSGVTLLHLPAPARRSTDYGMASLGSLDALREAMRPYARTMHVLGPRDRRDSTSASHAAGVVEAYFDYLNAGFELAPTAAWLPSAPAGSEYRTAVLARDLTRDGLLDGISRRRVYATADRNLRVSFSINGHPMGSVAQVTSGTPLRIEVTMSDPNEPEARYWVSLRRDRPGGSVEAASELFGTDYHGDGRVVLSQFHRGESNEYFLIAITQESAEGTDLVWTAPIWLVAPADVARGAAAW